MEGSNRNQSDAQLRRRREELNALYETTVAISQQEDLRELLVTIVRRAVSLLKAAMGGIYLVRPDGQSLELVTAYNLPGNLLGTVLQFGEGLSGKVAQRGHTMYVEDYASWEGRAAVYEGIPFRQVVGVPLTVEGKVIGVINVTNTEVGRPFDPREVRLVELFAGQAALAIRRAQLAAESRRREQQLARLYDLAVAITGAPDRETLLQRL
ncbi:MAG: GAF domain-containing protein, partial [Anaerolineae bacterium]|nr:GAF domain-containing protein [Anaerolineae bacterium]